MQKKIFSTILILCVLLCTMALTLSVGAADTFTEAQHDWTEKTTIDGVVFYVIDSHNDLIALSHTPDLWDDNFYVEYNVDLATNSVYKGTGNYTVLDGQTFQPIGNSTKPFKGKFIGAVATNGNRRVITLNFNNGTGAAGLFAYAGEGAVIENIVIGGSVTSSGSYVAGLVGYGKGNLTITDCTNRAVITGNIAVGGLIGGYNDDDGSTLTVTIGKNKFANEYKVDASGNVVDSKNGIIRATAEDDKNNNPEAKIGGAIGYIYVNTSTGSQITVENADNDGLIENSPQQRNVGGVVGYVYIDGNTSGAQIAFTNCDNTRPVSSQSYQLGGIVGVVLIQSGTEGSLAGIQTTGNTVTFTNCDNSGAIEASHYTGGVAGMIAIKHYAKNNAVTFTGCDNTGAVKVNGLYAGKKDDGTLDNGNNGKDVGGIVGRAMITEADNENETNNSISIDTCNNTGTVTAEYGSSEAAGGILGRAYFGKIKKAAIKVEGCTNGSDTDANLGKVVTNGEMAGGIVGYVQTYGLYSKNVDMTIDGAINYGAVIKNSEGLNGQIAGILGNANLYGEDITLTVKNSTNHVSFGTENAPLPIRNIGGVVGRIMISGGTNYSSLNNKVIIDTCVNKGSLYSDHIEDNATNVGGILGAFVFQTATDGADEQSYTGNSLEVKDCTNEGIVEGLGTGTYGDNKTGYSSNIGGIVGQVLNQYRTDSVAVTVSGCTNTGAISSVGYSVGGIMGYYRTIHGTDNATLKFENNVNSGTVNATLKFAGGILGQYHVHGATVDSDTNGTYAPKLEFVGNNKNKNTAAITAADSAGGILGIYHHENYIAGSAVFTIDGAENTGAVTATNQFAGGILGRYEVTNGGTLVNTASVVTVKNSDNTGAVTATNQHAAGIIGYFKLGRSADATVSVTDCTNKGVITSNYKIDDGACAGGILGYTEGSYSSNANFTVSNCTNGCNETTCTYGANCGAINVPNGKRGSGILADVNFSNTSNGMRLTISECNNYATINGKQEMAGILARVDAATAEGTLTVEKCANYGTVTATGSRAGGITATLFYQNKAGDTSFATYSQCYNEGAINAAYQAGGIAAQVITQTADNTTIENCLNRGAVTTTSTSARNSSGTAGIVGSGYYDDGDADDGVDDASFNIKNCYNLGAVSANTSSSYSGYIIGQHPNAGAANVEDSYYAPQSQALKITDGTKATEDVAFKTLGSIKDGTEFVWTYGRNNGLELKYFHVCVANNYSFNYSGTQLTTRCESLNCENTASPFGNVYTNVPDTVYVKNNSEFNSGAMYGTKDNPFKTLEEANDYIDLLEKDNITVVVVGVVEVPADYEIKAGVLTGEGTGTLYFKNMSRSDNKSLDFEHYHTFASKFNSASATKVENLTIKTATNDGLFFYAHGMPLEMGMGLTMVNEGDDKYNIVDTGSGQKDNVGARVYVFGGHNIQKHLGENAATLEFGNATTSADLSNKAPQTTPLTSNITVRSGEYRHVSGWSYDIQYMTPAGVEIEYVYPTKGTTTMTIGKKNASDVLRITNISPFGCDYESVGEGRVANITIDGEVEVYQFNFGAHLATKEGSERKYPVTINLCLAGDMYGMDPEKGYGTAEDLADNPWGFYAGGRSDLAVMGNVWIGVDSSSKYYKTAINDAHAFLGHFALCTEEDGAERDDAYNYANRSIIYIEPCICGNCEEQVSEYNLAATCISLPMNRKVCKNCGGFVRSEMVEDGVLNPENHAVFASLGFGNMYPVADGVRIGDNTVDNKCCSTAAAPTVGADGIFYVKDGGATKYGDGFGTETNPIGDFMTAYRLASAYAEYDADENDDVNGRTAEIRVIDSITWTLRNTSEGYNDSPNRVFDYHVQMPGKVVITSAYPENKATFNFELNPSTQRSKIRLSGALEMNNLNIDFINEYMESNGKTDYTKPTRIHLLARDNAITMGKGLTMLSHGKDGQWPYSNAIIDHSAQEHLCIHGGYDGAPSDVTISTEVTVLSGDYYYIGGLNYGTQGAVLNGTATMTIGATGTDKLSTGYLSSYGVGAENTDDFVSNMHIVGQVDVFTLEPTAQNGYVSTSDLGAYTQQKRISNIYLENGADLTLDRVHENGAFLRGEYEVNIYVDTTDKTSDAYKNTLTSLHKICGHDKGKSSEITGEYVNNVFTEGVNHQHINAFADICTDEDCTLNSYEYTGYATSPENGTKIENSFNGFSYLRADNETYGINAGFTSKIYVNVYEKDQDISALVSWKSGFDSGYYVDGETNYGIARFIFNGTPYAGTEDLLEDSGIIYLFTNSINGANFNNVIGKSGKAQTFYADVTKIPAPATGTTGETLYAVAYMKINGKIFYSPIKPGAVDFTRLVAID